MELQSLRRGAEADYALGTILGWDAFGVVRWHSIERLSQPFEYDIYLLRTAAEGPIDLDRLVDTAATFRMATEARWRSVHGVIAEVELVERTATMVIYRALLVPHVWCARYEVHCRTFVDQSLQEIVSAVLEGRAGGKAAGARGLALLSDEPTAPPAMPSFTDFREPVAQYRWALVDPARSQVKQPFVVQYNESDLAFVSRLLEAEGISYMFEHTADALVLTLTDHPGRSPLFARDAKYTLVPGPTAGTSRDQEVIRTLRQARRLRAGSVTMRDYAWRKSLTRLEATQGPGADLTHFEFPARDEDEPTRPGAAPAQFLLERFDVERALSRGSSTVRTLEPGYRFALVDAEGLRDDREQLVVAVETYAAELLPEATALAQDPVGFDPLRSPTEPLFENRFEVAPAEQRYRPRRETPKPKIFGLHTARVTAEETAGDAPPPELNSDEFGRVRLRFPWDERSVDGMASSKWVRVSQYWAGPGFGALYVPRVGHEVLVAYEDGDPHRPVVVGRLYNTQNPPPYMEPNTTKSTIKSESVGSDGSSAEGFNEFRFEDAAEKEQIYLHAQRNYDEVVLNNHTESVGGDESNSIGGNQSNTIGNNQTTDVGNNQTNTIGANRTTKVGANDKLSVGGTRDVDVKGNHTFHTQANLHSTADANHTFDSTNMYITQAGQFQVNATELWLNVSGTSLRMSAGMILLDNGAGASISLVGSEIVVEAGGKVKVDAGGNADITADGKALLYAKATATVAAGGDVDIGAGGNVNVDGTIIKLND